MPRGLRSLAAGALIALTVAGCGADTSDRDASPSAPREAVSRAQASPPLPAGWGWLRLPSGAALPDPAGWRAVPGDPGSASAALVNPGGTIRAYLNATPADRQETLAGWGRFRVRHNVAEGDRDVRLIATRSGVSLAAGPASCVVDEYATSRSRYRELACIVAPTKRGQAMVLVAAAQPSAWARERAVLDFALNHFTS